MLPTDTRNQDALAAAKKKADEKLRAQTKADWDWLMADARGRRIIWALLEFCGVFRTSFTGNSETFFKEGQRNVGLSILTRLDPDQHAIMTKENRANG
ncbi:hypothetical protein [Asticcacaulis sp.]|uniref:Bbp19 family protein n=1 Tax=Asticcacaulis sp. TaxID=1872648 RepID=UPI0031DE433E